MKRCYVVLGTHRTATSLIARMLHKSGICMGENFLGGDQLNPKGYFEDLDFLNLNKYLLGLLGGDWQNPPPHEKILALKNDKRSNQLIRALVSRRTERYDMWGWKDPRTVLTIDLFLPYLPETYFFCSFRDPRSVARSLHRGHSIDPARGYDLALEYNSRLLAFLTRMNKRGANIWPK